MKILMLNPPYTKISGIKSSAGMAAPLNLLYLISFIRKNHEYEITFLDCEAHDHLIEDIDQYFSKNSFDVVGMTCPTPVFNIVSSIADIAKKYNNDARIVIGGPHPSALPQVSLEQGKNIDFVVMGEGEETFYELLEALRTKSTDFHKIAGLGFRDHDGNIVINQKRNITISLDDLPFPARDIIDLNIYHSSPTKMVSGKKSTSILCSRGCYFNCIHCMSRTMTGKHVRIRSVANIVAEMEECRNKYGIEEFKFDDDNITMFKDNMIELCRQIKERKLDVVWMCMSRVDCITEELVKAMKDSGCLKISFGLESGNPDVLRKMRKGTNLDKARKAISILNKYKVDAHASFMLGNIGETEQTIKDTIDFACSLNLDYATFFITSPYPGTDLYDLAVQKGFIDSNTRWEQFAPITDQNPIVVQDAVSPEDLVRWQKIAFKRFYMRPKQVYRKVIRVRSFRQAKALIAGLEIFKGVLKKEVKNKK